MPGIAMRVVAMSAALLLAFGNVATAEAQTTKKKTTSTTTTRTALARQRAAQRAKVTAAQRAEREAMTAHFKRDQLGNLVPDVNAAAAIVYNPQTGEVIWEENSHDQRSIASLTKLMTVLTFMADEPDLTARVTVLSSDTRGANVTYLRATETITYRDLLHLVLIASDNAAARVLARTSEGGTAAFVGRMNEMASHLGLTSTSYVDPSGLDARNVSSAYDLSQLIAFVSSDDRISSVMRKAEYTATTSRRTVTVHNTNKLLGTDVDVRGGKTGFISKAGYCLATLLQVPQGGQVSVVVLGASNSPTRFWAARHLFAWVLGRAQGLVGSDDQHAIR